MENSEHSEVPLIGRDIPWEAIKEQYCRVKHFTPMAIVKSGKVRDASKILPYASMRVECPKVFQGEALMPVIHKLDFRNLWEVFKEIGINTEIMEVLVVYAPLKRRKLTKLLSGILPSLVIQLYPKGSLERLEGKRDVSIPAEEYLKSLLPITEWDARPDNLK